MKVTKANGRIIIDFEKEGTNEQIISVIKEYEESCRRSAELARAIGFVGTAAIDEVRADTADKILNMIEKILNK